MNAGENADEFIADDFRRDDRRRHLPFPEHGADELRQLLEANDRLGARHSVDHIAVRGESLVLSVLTTIFEQSESTVEMLVLAEFDGEDRILVETNFETDRLAEAFTELDQRWMATLDPTDAATYRIAAEQYAAYVGLDGDRFEELTGDQMAFVDHRRLGNFGELDRAGFSELFEARRDTLGPGFARVTAVHYLADGVVVWSKEEHTRSDRYGAQSTSSGIHVVRVVEGRVVRGEVYDDDDVGAAVARAEELIAGSRSGLRIENAASRWPDRAVDQDGSLADLSSLIADAFVGEDRRTALSDDHANPVPFLESLEDQRDLGARYSPELLAVRGERFALHRMTVRYDASEVEFLTVIEVDADGLAVHSVQFDSEDVQGAMDHLSRSWAATLPADIVPLLRLAAAYERVAYADEGDNEVFADDVAFVDHRQLGMGPFGLEEWRRFQGQRVNEGRRAGLAPEVVPVAAHVLLFSNVITIEAGDDASWEEFYFQLLVARGGKVARLEIFGEDQRGLAFERARQLAVP